MTGARVEFTVDTARPALKRALAAMQGEGRELMLGQMGEYLMRTTRERAEQEISPSGQKWRALEPGYARWKAKKRPGVPILKFDFHMLGDKFSHQVDGDTLYVGTNAPYGAIHQFGGTTQHPALSRKLSFAKDGKNGKKRFAKPGSADVDHEKWATVPDHSTTIAARPWLGVSDEDEVGLLEITADHIGGAFAGD